MSLLAAASGGWLVLGHASRASARTVARNIAWPVLAVFYFIFWCAVDLCNVRRRGSVVVDLCDVRRRFPVDAGQAYCVAVQLLRAAAPVSSERCDEDGDRRRVGARTHGILVPMVVIFA